MKIFKKELTAQDVDFGQNIFYVRGGKGGNETRYCRSLKPAGQIERLNVGGQQRGLLSPMV